MHGSGAPQLGGVDQPPSFAFYPPAHQEDTAEMEDHIERVEEEEMDAFLHMPSLPFSESATHMDDATQEVGSPMFALPSTMVQEHTRTPIFHAPAPQAFIPAPVKGPAPLPPARSQGKKNPASKTDAAKKKKRKRDEQAEDANHAIPAPALGRGSGSTPTAMVHPGMTGAMLPPAMMMHGQMHLKIQEAQRALLSLAPLLSGVEQGPFSLPLIVSHTLTLDQIRALQAVLGHAESVAQSQETLFAPPTHPPSLSATEGKPRKSKKAEESAETHVMQDLTAAHRAHWPAHFTANLPKQKQKKKTLSATDAPALLRRGSTSVLPLTPIDTAVPFRARSLEYVGIPSTLPTPTSAMAPPFDEEPVTVPFVINKIKHPLPISIAISTIDVHSISPTFVTANAIYPAALVEKSAYKGRRYEYEREYSFFGIKLAFLNPSLLADQKLHIVKAVETLRDLQHPIVPSVLLEKFRKRRLRLQQPCKKAKKAAAVAPGAQRPKTLDLMINGEVKKYKILPDCASGIPDDFKERNALYPRANCTKEAYVGPRWEYENECNQMGWILTWSNPGALISHRGELQAAVDAWRKLDTSQSGISASTFFAHSIAQQQQQHQEKEAASPEGCSSSSSTVSTSPPMALCHTTSLPHSPHALPFSTHLAPAEKPSSAPGSMRIADVDVLMPLHPTPGLLLDDHASKTSHTYMMPSTQRDGDAARLRHLLAEPKQSLSSTLLSHASPPTLHLPAVPTRGEERLSYDGESASFDEHATLFDFRSLVDEPFSSQAIF